MHQRITAPKRAGRKDRERKILLSLVEYFLRTGKPVGSQSLQEEGMPNISSATIRNHFMALEQKGYVKQQHSSGGRIPQAKAFREYAKECLDQFLHDKEHSISRPLPLPEEINTQDIIPLLQQTAQLLSREAHAAVAISSPKFDQDVVSDVHFVFLDVHRALAVVMTSFGLVHTTVILCDFPITHTLLKKADRFSRSRIFQEQLHPDLFEGEQLEQVRHLYQEALASYFISYSSNSQEDLWRAGFSQLLQLPEFGESQSLSPPLCLFESNTALRGLLREAVRSNELHVWIGNEILPQFTDDPNCSIVAIPYHVGNRAVGAIAVIGSMRLFYLQLFQLLKHLSSQLSRTLSTCLMHNQISYRMPEYDPSETKHLSIECIPHPQITHKGRKS